MSSAAANPTAAVIVIGNEVLSGKVKESNGQFFAEQFRELGVSLKTIVTVPDEREAIVEAVRREKARRDLVVTSGGVGPTHDDITMSCIADAFELPLEKNERFEALVRQSYGDKVNDHLMKMAWLPRGARLIDGEGLYVPVVAVENVYVFPGEPSLLRNKFRAIRSLFQGRPLHLRKIFTHMDEGELADAMTDAEKLYPGVAVGSYPVYGNPEYQVQITVEALDPNLTERAFQYIQSHIRPETLVRVE